MRHPLYFFLSCSSNSRYLQPPLSSHYLPILLFNSFTSNYLTSLQHWPRPHILTYSVYRINWDSTCLLLFPKIFKSPKKNKRFIIVFIVSPSLNSFNTRVNGSQQITNSYRAGQTIALKDTYPNLDISHSLNDVSSVCHLAFHAVCFELFDVVSYFQEY